MQDNPTLVTPTNRAISANGPSQQNSGLHHVFLHLDNYLGT